MGGGSSERISPLRTVKNRTLAHPWRASQIVNGTAITATAPTTSHGPTPRSRARPSAVATNPIARPASRASDVHLVSNASAVEAANASHAHREPVRSTRTAAHSMRAHASWSNETVWKSEFDAMANGSAHRAAMTWAQRRPPSSRATNAVTTTKPAPASEANVRSSTSDPPIARPSAAKRGTTGGKST